MEFYTNSTLAAYAEFDARGADRWSWLSTQRHSISSWNDVKDYAADTTIMASVEGTNQ